MIDRGPDVTIVGAGMAGMAAALKLLERGFSVRVLEASSGVGGQFGARPAKRGYHDFAWHIFAEWCRNFWEIARIIGLDKSEDFAARPHLTFLRPREGGGTWPTAATLSYIGSREFLWQNLRSGIADWSDLLLFTHSLYALLCDQHLERTEFLNRVPVNGYMRGLAYRSDVAALLHNELLVRIWAIPSYLISARAYQTYTQLIAPFTYPISPVSVLKKNFEEGFWQPFLRTVTGFGPRFALETEARLTGIRLNREGDRVDEIIVQRPGDGGRAEKVRQLIVAIPPIPLLEVVSHPDSAALRARVPTLLDLSKLATQPTAALTLYCRRRLEIPGVGEEPVSLIDHFESMYEPGTLAQRNGLASEYGLSFIETGRLWGAEHPTVLNVLAADADSLGRLDDGEACRRILDVLKRYVPLADEDVDWTYSHFQNHRDEPLFVNSVGSWEYRPEVRLVNSSGQPLTGQVWRTVRNLYLAGDFCRSEIDIVSLEGAIHTGIWAAHALSRAAVAEGRSEVGLVAPPLSPTKWDQAAALRTKAELELWAPLAAHRSRIVADRLKDAIRRRACERELAPLVPSTLGNSPPGEKGAVMSEALSTSPGFANPISALQTQWLGQHGDHTTSVTLKSGAAIALPLMFWEARALVLNGVADADALEGLPGFRDCGRRVEHVDPRTLEKKAGTGRGLVAIWAPNYGGTSVGPIQSVFAAIRVRKRLDCQHVVPRQGNDPDHVWWWWYYGSSPVNQEFKRDIWGVPNDLSMVETTYDGPRKGVRLLERGRIALRMRLDLTPERVAKWWMVKLPPDKFVKEAEIYPELQALGQALKLPTDPDALKGDNPLVFVTVARRPHDDGENEVELLGAKTWGPDVEGTPLIDGWKIPYIKDRDEFHTGPDTAVHENLESVGFEAVAWDYFAGYNGVVKLYDERGRPKPRVRPDEKLVESIEKGMASYEEAKRRRGQER